MHMERRESIAPLVLGIIGSVILLPSIACTVVCAMVGNEVSDAGSALESEGIAGAGLFGAVVGWVAIAFAAAVILACVLGFIGAVKSRANPKAGGIFLLFADLLLVFQLAAFFALTGQVFDFFSVAAVALKKNAMIICFAGAGRTDGYK